MQFVLKMYFLYFISLLVISCSAQPRKCDQTPPQAITLEPIVDQTLFQLKISNAEDNTFVPSQTYSLTLEATNASRQFCWFMITVEDPAVDKTSYDFRLKDVDVGSLKTLEDNVKSRYSERCANTVESFDNVPKPKVEIHWVSPRRTERVRFRAMVAENSEMWYTGDSLTLILERNKAPPKDEPPFQAVPHCALCSEARYEIFFKGRWSRLEHPRHYPSKPDDNGYSHMIGASHAYNFTLWAPETEASQGMTDLASKSYVSTLERDIINEMNEEGGTRTLIRGKRRRHPNMDKWSHALFRVDRIHHLFSIAVAMRPSPDWFLGTKKFELCTKDGWLEHHEMPLYPWDAGVMDGVSYDSTPSQTQPKGNIKRVEVGSFNPHSPFYQTNLNQLKPFAFLEIRRLDVYPLHEEECAVKDKTENSESPASETDEEEGDGEQEENEEEESQESVIQASSGVKFCIRCLQAVVGITEGTLTRQLLLTRCNRRHGFHTKFGVSAIVSDPDGPMIAESKQKARCILGEWGDWSPCVPDVGGCGIGAQTRSRVRRFRYDDYNEDDFPGFSSDSNSCQALGDPKPMEIRNCIIEC